MKQTLKRKSSSSWLIAGLTIFSSLGGLYSAEVFGDPASKSQVDQSTLAATDFNIKRQKPKNNPLKSLTEDAIEISAHISIYTAELFASDTAEKELNKFRTGEHNGTPSLYSFNSAGSQELFKGKYYRELTTHLVEELAKWYKGKIPSFDGLFSQANSFRVFAPSDALWEMTDGIDMADIIGTFTYYVRATTDEGIIYFQGINKISLESYSGENYLGHGLVNNPKLGPLSSTAQVFKWQVKIPEKYLK